MALRIVHVETGMHLYGGALQVFYLLRGLCAQGCQNILVCSKGSAIGDEACRFGHILALPMRGDADMSFIPRLAHIVRRLRPDIVHLHSRRGADTLGLIAARLARARVVLTRRVDNPEPRWVARGKYGLCGRVIAISNGIREVLISEGVPSGKIQCVRSAVDTGKYTPGGDEEWFRSQFGTAPGDRVVGVVAQLIPRKGHRHLLAAIPEILEGCPGTRFLFFGRGPLEATIREQIARLRLAGHVHLAGFRADLDRILPCLDVLAHPAEMEGLGIALLQAAACGVPIVATRVGGIPEVIHDGGNGLLVPAGDPPALAEGLTGILRDPPRARRMGAAGRRLVEEKFSIPAMVRGNLEIYRRLVSDGA